MEYSGIFYFVHGLFCLIYISDYAHCVKLYYFCCSAIFCTEYATHLFILPLMMRSSFGLLWIELLYGYTNNAGSSLLVYMLSCGFGLRTGTFLVLENLQMLILGIHHILKNQELQRWCPVIWILTSLTGDSCEWYSLKFIT